uniref:Uncharacterized protein n=1 Tax=Candidatus Kentrum sp. UNK TaxID=2126344 RepID=A0A451B5Q2_9GAMM|nr:MAG: hypothetical protein BECKUNK1418G_GA0071005_12255 [Candidatus Kentron sp. UNK]VFK73601.1 MAG: hypothetical protein BECKUNK1418H_GA0071006_12275 [Candidatus Kentron sp. UNK]
MEIAALPARKPTGAIDKIHLLRLQLEEQVRCAIEDQGKIVVLHQVERSKTGIEILFPSFLERLKEKYQDNLIIVIDAAQMRGNESFSRYRKNKVPGRIGARAKTHPAPVLAQSANMFLEYLNAGFCILGTGSKFFSGAPFSGFLLFPTAKRELLSCGDIAAGLGDYFARDEVDERLITLKEALPTRRNYGLLLRWETALANIEQYASIPFEKRAYIIFRWGKKVRKLVTETAHVNLLDKSAEIKNDYFQHGECNTIISFTLHPAIQNTSVKALGTGALKVVHQWMTKDISANLPNNATFEERLAVSHKCLIGQPVEISEAPEIGVLRIALSAPMVCQMAKENRIAEMKRRIARELEDDRRILDKLSLIGKYYYFLTKNL